MKKRKKYGLKADFRATQFSKREEKRYRLADRSPSGN